MPSDARIDDARTGFLNGLGQLNYFVPTASIRYQIQHAQPVHDDEIISHAFTDAPNDFHGEAHSIFKASAVPVFPMVGRGHEELIDQVPFGTHDLYTIVPCGFCEVSRMHKIFNCSLDPSF